MIALLTSEERLHIVEAFVNDVDICNRMHNELLRRIPDLQAIVKKILRNKGSLQVYIFKMDRSDCSHFILHFVGLPSNVSSC